jgi:hypothetical protein
MYDDFKNDLLRQWPMNREIQTVELRLKEYAARAELDEREMELCRRHGRLETFRDIAQQRLVMILRAEIYGKDHPKKHVIRYPETWWEAVKERFGPAWFLDRFPVRFVEISASLEELYPEIEPALADKMPVMKFYINKEVGNT